MEIQWLRLWTSNAGGMDSIHDWGTKIPCAMWGVDKKKKKKKTSTVNNPMFKWMIAVTVVVQSLCHVWLFTTPRTTVCQAPLSSSIFWCLLKFMFIESIMLSNYFILYCPFSFYCQSSQHQHLSQWVSSSHQVAKVLEHQLQHQSFQWIFRVDFL